LVMVQEDMFAHKLMAMHERIGKTSHDVYDVWFFWRITGKLIKKLSSNVPARHLKRFCD